jgi:hypothetical protein
MMVKKSDEDSRALALNETVGENYSPTSRVTEFRFFHFEKLNGKYMNRKKGKKKRKRKKSKSNQTNKYDPLSHDHNKKKNTNTN